MQFVVHAAGQGKRVRVVDRVGGGDAFNQFIDPDQEADVTVGSNDGQTGDVDIIVQMRSDSVWVNYKTDYPVQANEVVDINDV
jgi:hypothetical protein